eukprot:TRINITY_DN16373_c0_g1_i1.p1 TRINITY_DN16373_c0_g1~~TRINITY_DN16373_c0_g1_i1.p1  ORF type:complete len:197 (+),score=44.82 TRINITY_DN16373_c0_g1_i1:161-751(+)
MTYRRQRSLSLLLLGLALIAASLMSKLATAGHEDATAFATTGAMASRRVVLSGALPMLLGAGLSNPALAVPIVSDRKEYMQRRKLELVPIFKQGIDYLQRKGADDRMMLFLPKMVRKMRVYAAIQSSTDAPDKTARTMDKLTTKFEKAVTDKKVEEALAFFEEYRLTVPGIVAAFDLDDPSTYNGPNSEDVPSPEA